MATSPPSSSSGPHRGQPPVPGVLQLERFLDTVLKDALKRVLTQRDAARTAASQCTHLIALFDDMQAMSRRRSFIAAASANDRARQQRQAQQPQQQDPLEEEKDSSAAQRATVSTSASTAANRPSASQPPQTNKILVDLGHHFYTQGFIRNAERVHVNIGCGVVLPMSLAEAKAYLIKKERVLRERASMYTREVLRTKYRIRLVTEAIGRLHEREVGSRH